MPHPPAASAPPQWEALPAPPKRQRGGFQPAPPKLRVVVMTSMGRLRPYGLLTKAAITHLQAHDARRIVIQRDSDDHRSLRLHVVEDDEVLPEGAVPMLIRWGDSSLGGKVLLRYALPGTDVLLTPDGRDLIGRVPDDKALPEDEPEMVAKLLSTFHAAP